MGLGKLGKWFGIIKLIIEFIKAGKDQGLFEKAPGVERLGLLSAPENSEKFTDEEKQAIATYIVSELENL